MNKAAKKSIGQFGLRHVTFAGVLIIPMIEPVE